MEQLPDFSGSNNECLDRTYGDTPRCDLSGSLNNSIMSEERKIWDELELEIERDLEEEIKDGIYHLALRLHRLYQHKKCKNKQTSSASSGGLRSEPSDDTFTEVNISIKMEGGCKIEIYESKGDAANIARPRSLRSKAKRGRASGGGKRYDWSRTLRTGAASGSPTNKKHDVLDHGMNKNKELGWKY